MHELFRTKVKIDIDKFDEIAASEKQKNEKHKRSRIFHLIKEFLGFSNM